MDSGDKEGLAKCRIREFSGCVPFMKKPYAVKASGVGRELYPFYTYFRSLFGIYAFLFPYLL